MGLLEKLRNELVDVIECAEQTRTNLVWRFPRYHNQIKNGAQLIVRPGQAAVFVHRGQLADIFPPGHHELKTSNLPVLSTLQGWMHGFDSPFKSEVYFVSTRVVTDLKWGTPNPILLRDSEFGPIRVRAFGTFTLKASDPKLLLNEFVGAQSEFEADEIQEFVRSLILSTFADMLARCEVAMVDLAGNYVELAEQLRVKVVERMDFEYGLDMPQLCIVNVSLPESVEKALDARTSMNMIGDLNRYQQYQMGQAFGGTMTSASTSPMIEGLGVGVGLGMAQQFAPIGVAASQAAPGLGQTLWHVAENGQSKGPFTEAQLVEAISRGQVPQSVPVWTAGMETWVAADRTPLAKRIRTQCPPVPAAPK